MDREDLYNIYVGNINPNSDTVKENLKPTDPENEDMDVGGIFSENVYELKDYIINTIPRGAFSGIRIVHYPKEDVWAWGDSWGTVHEYLESDMHDYHGFGWDTERFMAYSTDESDEEMVDYYDVDMKVYVYDGFKVCDCGYAFDNTSLYKALGKPKEVYEWNQPSAIDESFNYREEYAEKSVSFDAVYDNAEKYFNKEEIAKICKPIIAPKGFYGKCFITQDGIIYNVDAVSVSHSGFLFETFEKCFADVEGFHLDTYDWSDDDMEEMWGRINEIACFTLGWIQCSTELGYTAIQIEPTAKQYEALEEWMYNRFGKGFNTIQINAFRDEWEFQTYEMGDGLLPEDIIKKIKRFYATGILVENELGETYIKHDFETATAGYILPDGSLAYMDEYHGEDAEYRAKGLPEFSNTHCEEDTCVRIFDEPNNKQYERLEEIIDTYLDNEEYCKVEIGDDFYEVFSLRENACQDPYWDEKIGNWTGYKLVRLIKNYFERKANQA